MEKHLLITRFDAARAARGEMLAIEDVLEILSVPLLGIIPESEAMPPESNRATTAPPDVSPSLGCRDSLTLIQSRDRPDRWGAASRFETSLQAHRTGVPEQVLEAG
jgi:septum site-determining protein MinD